MDLATMRTKFRKRTSGLTDALDDSDVDNFLNRAYQYNIPRDIPGQAMDGVWSLDVDAGEVAYAYPSYVIAPRTRAVYWQQSRTLDTDPWDKTSAHFIDVETDRASFIYSDREIPWEDTSGPPQSILFYGEEAVVSPQPDKIYRLVIEARVGPQNALGVNGLQNDTHAMLVVTAAAVEFLDDEEDDIGAGRQRSSYGEYKSLFIAQSQSMPRHRTPRRSF